MKKLVTFIKGIIKEIYARIWWHFYGEAFMKKMDEDQVLRGRKEAEESEANLEWYCKDCEAREIERQVETAKWMKKLEEEDEKITLRLQQEDDDYLEDLRIAREEEDDRNRCHVHGELDCFCEQTVENFSEHPSLAAEDDAEHLSPEMEYWFTRCDKCGQYPEFCPCDGKFED